MSEKSILEQALLQVQNLEEAVKQNAKGILASTMKEELKDLLKESLEEEEDVDVMEQPETETDPEGEEEQDVTSDDEEETDDESDDDVDTDVDTDTDLDNTEDSTDDVEDEVDTDVDMDDMDAETDMDTDMESMDDEGSMEDEDVMDMTNASDDEVLKVFKAMKPEDGIVVKKDGNNVEFGDGEDEYIIKLDGEDSDMGTDMDMDTDVDSDVDMDDMDMDTDVDAEVDEDWNEEEMPSEDNEETIYEIELDEEDEVEEPKKVEATEAARTKSNPHGNKNGMKRAGLPSKKMYKAGSGINEQVETLKKQNAEYKKALVLFKDKLNEVAVFNANLAYATRLFTEHSTTKQEKLNILKRFDTVSTMNESKGLFNTIKTELGSKTTVTESVATKISNTPSSSSTQVLSEAKAYENPQFSRIKEMMRKIK